MKINTIFFIFLFYSFCAALDPAYSSRSNFSEGIDTGVLVDAGKNKTNVPMTDFEHYFAQKKEGKVCEDKCEKDYNICL